jgi:hypothetical protein
MNRRLAPSIPAISFMLWAVVPALLFPGRMLNADGDLLRHIGHGDWMLRHHALVSADPFSFTMGGQAFIGFEYGSQLIFALVNRAAGLAGIALLSGLLIATAYALLARFLLARGTDPFLTYIVTVAAAVLGAFHWAARPHLFTLVAVVLLLPMLEDGRMNGWTDGQGSAVDGPQSATARRQWTVDRRLLWALPLFAIWANLHGGWVFGLVLIGIYLAGHAVEYLFNNDRPHELRQMRYLALLFVAGLLGTLLNPHFLALHRHTIGFFGQSFVLDNTNEFMSPDFHHLFGKILMAALLGMITVLACLRTRPHASRLFLLLAMTYFVLTAQRNIQLFSVTAVPILAMLADPRWRRLPDWRGIRAVFQRDAPLGRTAPLVLATAAVFGFLAVGRGKMLGRQIVPDALSADVFPIAVVRRARAEHLEGRIYHSFIWGGYLIYAWPEQRVFIDGGTDFYGAAILRSYMDIGGLAPFWRNELERWDISLVLVPTESSLAHELLREPGWLLHDCDSTAALLQKTGAAARPAAADSLLESCKHRGIER